MYFWRFKVLSKDDEVQRKGCKLLYENLVNFCKFGCDSFYLKILLKN